MSAEKQITLSEVILVGKGLEGIKLKITCQNREDMIIFLDSLASRFGDPKKQQ